MGRRVGLAAFVSIVVLVGCGVTGSSSSGISYPAGPSLEQFGLRERCPQGGECGDRAMEAFVAALGRLGPEIRNTPITSPGGAPAAAPVPEDRLYVEITVDPMLDWLATTGGGGSGSAFRVDLTDENPYVVVAPRYSFRLGEADAAAIRDALFVDR
jgi:hypothetical protein